MTEQPLVSIVIRTKDRTRMLARALDDVMDQTYPVWEAIVVNDGGDADTVEAALASRAGLSGRARAIHLPSSRGMETASNVGVAAAAGEFIAIHDDDDTWHEEFLTRTVAHLVSAPSSLAVTVPTEIVQEREQGDEFVETARWPFVPAHDMVSLTDLLVSNRVVPISMLVRAEAVRTLGGFDESLDVVGDWEFNLRLAAMGNIDYLAGASLAQWRQRPEGTGALANSVFAARAEHIRFDRVVRDRALRAEAETAGLGTPLFMAKLVDDAERRIMDRLDRIEQQLASRLDDVEHHVRTNSPGAFMRRAFGRMIGKSGEK